MFERIAIDEMIEVLDSYALDQRGVFDDDDVLSEKVCEAKNSEKFE